jgi:hypothetical protein
MIHEHEELFLRLWVAPDVVPLLVWMPAEPLFFASDFEPASNCTHAVYAVGPGTGNVSGDLDLLHIRALVVTPVVCVRCGKRVLLEHLAEALDTKIASQHILLDHVVEQVASVDATTSELLSVEISATFPRRDGLERRWVKSCNEPLNDG